MKKSKTGFCRFLSAEAAVFRNENLPSRKAFSPSRRGVLFCSNQPSMSSESLRTIWTSASCRTTGNGAFPLVPFLALPPYLARTHRQELLRNLITILLPIPLSSNVRKERCKIVLSRNCQESTAIRIASHCICFTTPATLPELHVPCQENHSATC